MIDENSPLSDEMSEPEKEYDVDVDEAAALLGVGRTRLSQLTSKEVFSFHRRKIGSRNRLFYNRRELLLYLEKQSGALTRLRNLQKFSESPSEELSDDGAESANQENSPLTLERSLSSQARPALRSHPTTGLKSAFDIRTAIENKEMLGDVLHSLSLMNEQLVQLQQKILSLTLISEAQRRKIGLLEKKCGSFSLEKSKENEVAAAQEVSAPRQRTEVRSVRKLKREAKQRFL